MFKEKKQKFVYLGAFLCMALGIGYLIFSGLNKNSVYFLHVSEALAKGPQNIEKVRLFGQVSEDLPVDKIKHAGIEFELVDKNNPSQSIAVRYKGVLPDSFKPGAEVIVKGSMDENGNLFRAHSLMTKCPSKYEKNS